MVHPAPRPLLLAASDGMLAGDVRPLVVRADERLEEGTGGNDG